MFNFKFLLTFLIIGLIIFLFTLHLNYLFSTKIVKKIYYFQLFFFILLITSFTFGFKYRHTSNFFLSIYINYIFFILLALLMAMLIALLFFFINDIGLGINLLLQFFKSQKNNVLPSTNSKFPAITRRNFLVWVGLLSSSLLLFSLIKGFFNKYNFTFHKIKVKFKNLPKNFDNFKIIQISDIHSGSFSQKKPLIKLINKINQLNPDLIVFTGDLVNTFANEVKEFIPIFKQLKAKMGVYSILGNHDYGDYFDWKNLADKEQNFAQLKDAHRQLNWQLLLNENVKIQDPKSTDFFYLIGVENWSKNKRFGQHGDINKAIEGIPNQAFQILLSHDPSHFAYEISVKYPQINLTLSGHTHGFQFGLENPLIKWSPVQYVYKYWAGLYKVNHQYIYVNRGLGCIGYQGRVGILPEITEIQLSQLNDFS